MNQPTPPHDETRQSEPIPSTPPCSLCRHPKRDHDGRADHRAKHSPLVAGEPWCHACNAECDYAATPPAPAPAARRDRYAEALLDHLSRTADIRPCKDDQLAFMPEVTDTERMRIADAVVAVADTELAELREKLRKAERAADLLAGSHRRAEQAEARVAVLEQQHTSLQADVLREADWIVDHCPDHGCVEPETEVCHCEIAGRLRRLADEPADGPAQPTA